MEDIYNRNLEVIQSTGSKLYDELSHIDTNTEFEVFPSENGKSFDILDTQLARWVCKATSGELEDKLEDMKKYREYPFLYMFGISNGSLLDELLKNKKHNQIIVVEPSIELIYIALHLTDFSEDLKTRRLVLLNSELFTFKNAIEILHSANAKFYSKLFKLHSTSEYYLEYKIDRYKETSDMYLKTIQHVINAAGNDVGDSLIGLKHHIKNLPTMVKHPKFSELKASKNSDLAVIVSTGPSLTKQLDLLKQAAPYITIISLDASFPILVKNGIKPDIVVSMERVEATSKFFIETTKEEQEGVVFLCASLQHESVLNSIKGGQLLLSMRPFVYNVYFGLNDYGYICLGMSSANMAHELAYQMGYETCAFIGQDLAYGKDGNSHGKGHVFGADQIKEDNTTDLLLPGYGNKGTVRSTPIWKIFLRFIEQNIENTQDEMTSINATEGGVHIQGSVEMPFSEAIDKYKLNKEKRKIVLTDLSEEEVEANMTKIKIKIKSIIEKGTALKAKIDESFLIVANECKALENLTQEEALKVFDTGKMVYLLETISAIRKEVSTNNLYTQFIENIAQSTLYHEELKLAQIKVAYVDSEEENTLKAIRWILEHRMWLFSLSGIIDNILSIVIDNSNAFMDQE